MLQLDSALYAQSAIAAYIAFNSRESGMGTINVNRHDLDVGRITLPDPLTRYTTPNDLDRIYFLRLKGSIVILVCQLFRLHFSAFDVCWRCIGIA